MTEIEYSKICPQSLGHSAKETALAIIPSLQRALQNHERSFYGESFTAAALATLGKNNDLQNTFVELFLRNDEAPSHPEFNLFAWQAFLQKTTNNHIAALVSRPRFKKIFLNKVSNWVLLRSLVRIQTGRHAQRWIGLLEAHLILRYNTYQGYITDNTLRMLHERKKSVSSQYHAFATLLVGLIAETLPSPTLQKKFIHYLHTSRAEITADGHLKMRGRGRQQLFGYAAMLYALALAFRYTKKKEYLLDFQNILTYITSFTQKNNGEIPIVLTNQDPTPYLYSYNNTVDYLAFLCFVLARTSRLLISDDITHSCPPSWAGK